MIDHEFELGGAHFHHGERDLDEDRVFHAWTNPRTWVTSEVVTSSIMNTHVRDNLEQVWREVAYTEKTTDTAITATTQATGNTVVTSGSYTVITGDIIRIRLQAFNLVRGTNNIKVTLFEDATVVQDVTQNLGTSPVALAIEIRRAPTSGAKTWSMRAYVDAGSGTVQATSFAPASIWVDRKAA